MSFFDSNYTRFNLWVIGLYFFGVSLGLMIGTLIPVLFTQLAGICLFFGSFILLSYIQVMKPSFLKMNKTTDPMNPDLVDYTIDELYLKNASSSKKVLNSTKKK